MDLTWVRISQLCGAGSARIKSKADKTDNRAILPFLLEGLSQKVVVEQSPSHCAGTIGALPLKAVHGCTGQGRSQTMQLLESSLTTPELN